MILLFFLTVVICTIPTSVLSGVCHPSCASDPSSRCQSNGMCLCWWGWSGPNSYYIPNGPLKNRIVADYCKTPCSYSRYHRNPLCGTILTPSTVTPPPPSQQCVIPHVSKHKPSTPCHPLCTASGYQSKGQCLHSGRCLCHWGWAGENACYITSGRYQKKILADFCSIPCHYTHDYTNPKCLKLTLPTGSTTVTSSSVSVSTGDSSTQTTTDQGTTQSTMSTTVQPTTDAATDLTTKQTTDSSTTQQTTTAPTTQSTTELTTQTTDSSTTEQPTTILTTQSTENPSTQQPTTIATTQSTTEQVTQTTESPTTTVQSTTQSTTEQVTQTTEIPTTVQPTTQSTTEQVTQTTETPTTVQPTTQSTTQQVTQTTETPTTVWPTTQSTTQQATTQQPTTQAPTTVVTIAQPTTTATTQQTTTEAPTTEEEEPTEPSEPPGFAVSFQTNNKDASVKQQVKSSENGFKMSGGSHKAANLLGVAGGAIVLLMVLVVGAYVMNKRFGRHAGYQRLLI